MRDFEVPSAAINGFAMRAVPPHFLLQCVHLRQDACVAAHKPLLQLLVLVILQCMAWYTGVQSCSAGSANPLSAAVRAPMARGGVAVCGVVVRIPMARGGAAVCGVVVHVPMARCGAAVLLQCVL